MDRNSVLREWLRLARSGMTNRAAAAALGRSEAALLDSARGRFATPLATDVRALLEAARTLGVAKWVVRNDWAVLERTGTIATLGTSPAGGVLVCGSSFRLEIAEARAGRAFALEETRPSGAKRSLQLFDAAGASLVKLVFRADDSARGFDRLAREFHDPCALPADSPVHRAAQGVTRAEAGGAGPLARFLARASELELPLALQVRNGGASLQAWTAIRHVRRSRRAPWINVLDPGLDLHLHEARIRRFRVRSAGGAVCSLDWRADDGSCAFSTEVPTAFAEWLIALSEANDLQERAIEE